jgi:class 3 adenylate cyclase
MFTDPVGSTALSTRFDPEDLRAAIAAYRKCVAETVSRFGFVAKYVYQILGRRRAPLFRLPVGA